MLIGAVIGAAMGAGADIATDVVTGQSVNWGQVGKDAAVGAVAGAVSGLVGPEAGPLVRAAVDTGAAVAGQVTGNIIDHKPLGDGVLTAAAMGAATSVGLGFLAEVGGQALGRMAGKAGEALETAADSGASDVSSAADGAGETGPTSCAVGGLSFSADTQVATPGGERPIASLKVGDHVLAYNPATGNMTAQTIVKVYLNHDHDRLDITLALRARTRP